jgi:pimeloyl-ACP methyl ester carboxylesterase
MTQLAKVQYTATAHTTGGQDGASRSDDGRLDVKLSTPSTPGTGTNPEVNQSPTAKLVLPRRRMIKSAVSSSPTRRSFLASSAAAGAFGLLPRFLVVLFAATVSLAPPATVRAQQPPQTGVQAQGAAMARAAEADAVRPFRINVPEAALVDLRGRVAATRWPDRETVTDQSQGVPLAKIQALVRYWGTDYDWRKAEAKLNAWPQFVTEIDGLDIQFVHVRSRHPNALPLIMSHGWPGSIFELLKVIGPLTDPTAYGGRVEDAFDLVLPSLPGYGFSGKPQSTGWGPDRIGRAWDELMRRLGYTRYVSQGGDWGAVVSDVMARQAPAGLLGIHVNMPATVPPEVAKALNNGEPAPAGLSDNEKAAFEQLDAFYKTSSGYSAMMVTRPQTLGYGLADSPAGLAAWFYDKFVSWTHSGGEPERSLTRDEMLDDITLYWLTNTGTSSAQLYWENNANNFNAVDISIPAAVTVFPGEIYRAPRSWAERSYHKLIYFHEVEKGGHFAAWEEPELFAAEIRAAFRPLR